MSTKSIGAEGEDKVEMPPTPVAPDLRSSTTRSSLPSETHRTSSSTNISSASPQTETEADDDKPTEQKFKTGLVDQTNYLPPKQVIIVLMALNLSVALSFLDQTIVSTALPSISASFNAGRSSSWVASAYLLTTTAFLPVWGRLSDVFGRKVTLLCCVTVFAISSIGAALAQTILQLIIMRGFQGCGGGGILTLVLIIISDIVSLKERGKYQGIMEGTIAISNGVGPLLGGVLSEKASWRWCFWINLPLAALTVIVIITFLPLKRVKGDFKHKLLQIDYMGSFLTIIAATLLLLPLNWGGVSFAWNSATVLGCLFGSLGFWILLAIWELKFAKIPIISPAIFRFGTVNAVFACTTVSGMVILTQLFYIPQYLQIVRGDSPIRSGVLILPLLLVTTAMVIFSGQLQARTGEYKPPIAIIRSICIGYAIWTVGTGLLSTMNQNTSTARIVGYLIITALGQGQTLQTTMIAAQATVERSEMSVVTSTRNFLRSLGGTLALCLGSTMINNTLRGQLLPQGFSSAIINAIINDSTGIWRPDSASASTLFDLPQSDKDQIIAAYVKGFQTVFHVYIGLLGMNIIISTLFIKRVNLQRAGEEKLKEEGKAWIEQRGHKGRGNHGKEVDLEKNSVETVKELEQQEGGASISEKGTLVDETVSEKVKEEVMLKESGELPR